MRIGDLARQSGVTTRQLRYYEEQGLLHPVRSMNNYREYADEAVEQVQQIRGLLDSGLPTRVIRLLLPCVHGPGAELPPKANTEMAGMLRDELKNIQARIAQLSHSRDQVERYLARVS